MTNKNNIERLQEGIFLDGENTLIPWFASLENLSKFGNPEIYDEGRKPSGLKYKTPYKQFVWRNKSWCGIQCDIYTTLYNRDAKVLKKAIPDSTWYYSSEAKYFYISNVFMQGSIDNRDVYKKLKNIFIEQFGTPKETKNILEYGRDYPWNLWKIGKIQLSLVMQERFVDFNTIMLRILDTQEDKKNLPNIIFSWIISPVIYAIQKLL